MLFDGRKNIYVDFADFFSSFFFAIVLNPSPLYAPSYIHVFNRLEMTVIKLFPTLLTSSLNLILLPLGHRGRVVTLSPPTSEVGVQFPALPQVGKLVIACRWSAVYSTEP